MNTSSHVAGFVISEDYPFLCFKKNWSFYVNIISQTITAILQGLDKDTSNELNAVTEGYPIGIVKTRDGEYKLVGLTDGIDFSIEATTGATQSEFSGYTLTGVSIEKDLAPTLDSATVTAFLATVAVNA